MKFILKTTKYALAFLLLCALFWLAIGLFPNPLSEPGQWDWSVKINDRHGRLLKTFLPPQTARREARPLSDFSQNLVSAVLAAEDKRFYRHVGIDPLAMLRAARLNLKHKRIVSGGSTITMQLARLNRGLAPGPRTFERKFKEIWWSLLIERHNSKETILAEYLNRAPCGNLTEGFPAAARLYLNKSVADLSMAESAFLAALPASPGALNPYKDPRPALARRSGILDKMKNLGFISDSETKRAKAEPLALGSPANVFNAPHFVSYLRRNLDEKPSAVITSTLDLAIQQKIEKQVWDTAALFREQGMDQAAVLVMSLPEREILAWVGSSDFFEAEKGQNDGVTALRQPGSALKPFIYATAFENGLITPATLMDDSAVDYRVSKGSFSPSNYSGAFHGAVSARLALASSLNLPAIKLAEKTGVSTILNRLRELGLNSLNREADYYGLGLALGGGEVDLLSLTTAYAVLADQGRLKKPVFTLDDQNSREEEHLIFSPGAAFLISDILSDPRARATGFGSGSVLDTPYPSAVKTGTSKSFRDNWCLGYTGGYVIGVWAGNFESNPMNKVSGVTGAGTIWRAVADLLAEQRPTPEFRQPKDVVSLQICPVSGLLAGPNCPNLKLEFFLNGRTPSDVCPHQELEGGLLMQASVPVMGLKREFGLLRPLNGEIYAWDPEIKASVQQIKARVQSVPEVDLLVWSLNGRELARQPVEDYARRDCLVPLTPGASHLEVVGFQGGEALFRSDVSYTVR